MSSSENAGEMDSVIMSRKFWFSIKNNVKVMQLTQTYLYLLRCNCPWIIDDTNKESALINQFSASVNMW